MQTRHSNDSRRPGRGAAIAIGIVAVCSLRPPSATARPVPAGDRPSAGPVEAGDPTAEPPVDVPKSSGDEHDPLSFFGDFRARFEIDRRAGGGVDESEDTRVRPRLRARFGLKYQTPVKGVSFALRLASSPGDPGNSPHRTFDVLTRDDFEIDRAYLAYEPRQGLVVTIGKQAYPNWHQTEILWDEDIQPEGFSAGYSRDLGGAGTVGLDLGYFYIHNESWTDTLFKNDAFGTAQLAYKRSFGKVGLTLAGTGAFFADKDLPTNVVNGSDGVTDYDFRDVNYFLGSVQLTTENTPVTVTAGFDYIKSTATADNIDEPHDTGWVAQLRLNRDRLGARAYYYMIQETSVPLWGDNSPGGDILFTQDNFPNSNSTALTGFKGLRLQLDLQIGKGLAADFRAYLQTGLADNVLALAEVPGRKVQRFQLNLNAKF